MKDSKPPICFFPDLTVVTVVLLQAALEAEEEESPGGDVEEEGEADTEGGEEHRADRVAAPEGQN